MNGWQRWVVCAIGCFSLVAESEIQAAVGEKAVAQVSCKDIPYGQLDAMLDRAALANPTSKNKMLKGSFLWSEDGPAQYEGVFSGEWNISDTPFGGKVSWRFDAKEGMYSAELDLGDGTKLSTTARHLITIANEPCKALTYYEIALKQDWVEKLKKSKSIAIRLTGNVPGAK